uniref:Uncharacterized protein n=1 Tax=Moniliophthora roreri TaxID=221103 RepID=A0A0W0G857_MONRR
MQKQTQPLFATGTFADGSYTYWYGSPDNRSLTTMSNKIHYRGNTSALGSTALYDELLTLDTPYWWHDEHYATG